RRPKTEAMVFSWAPPTINRVMTCVTRMARASGFGGSRGCGFVRRGGLRRRGRFLAFEFLDALDHELTLDRTGDGVGQIRFGVSERGVGLLAAISDFVQAEVNLERARVLALQG